MASVSASDASDINDNHTYISLDDDSARSSLVGGNSALSGSDADLVSSADDAAIESNVKSSSKSNALSDSSALTATTKNSTAIVSSSSKVIKGENYSVTLKDKNGKVLSGKKLSFTLNSKAYNRTTNSKGVASLTLNLNVGNYLILVKFSGDSSYLNSSLSKQVAVSKIPTVINNSTSVGVIGKPYSVTLKDKNGKALSSKAVSLSFNGKTYNRTTNANGTANITLSGKVANTYTLSYKFAGDNSYLASSGSVSLKLKMPTKIVASGARIVRGDTFTVVLKDADDNALGNKKVTVLHNGVTYNKTSDSKGVVSLTLNETPGKYYNITYKFAGDGNYVGSSKKVSVFIKTPTKLINSGSVVCKGNVYTIILKDASNKALANMPVTLTYGSSTYNRTTNSSGMAGLKVNTAAGTVKNLTYKFNGDSLYGSSSGSVSLRTKLATSLTKSASAVVKGTPFKITLKDADGKALANKTVTFNLSSTKSYNRTTDANGTAGLTINLAEGKSYKISYSYAGSGLYNKSSGSVNLAVKLATAIENSGSVVLNGSSYAVTLKDSNSTPLAKKVITFTLDNKTYTNTTNSKGVARLVIAQKTIKTTKLTYKFAGDSMYASSAGSVELNVYSDKAFTFDQITDASKRLRKYVESNAKIPSTITVNGIKINITSFAYLMSKAVVNVNNGKKINIDVVKVSANYSNSGKSSISANLYKADYVKLANYLINYTQTNKKIPNSINTSIGALSPNLYIFGLSKSLDFYKDYSYLPNYLILNSEDVNGGESGEESGGEDAGEIKYGNASQNKKGLNEAQSLNSTQLSSYLSSSGNDALNSAIEDLAKQLVSGKSSTLAKANAIFAYVRDNIDYEYYADTKYKATGTLSSKRGNCCDHANLVVALCRAANIPARYSHGQGCTFSSGLVTGHVWAQIYIEGVWYSADATSKRNGLGNIHNWNTNYFNSLKQYVHLPF